ncbi:hypothetical protein Y032_0550g3318 [Ancylostoma ceylanicum]|uniref:Uncharacterized protein n=1 Tax=Ancylostoma ceylanicum TaxID=53326 RepID=A0A016WQS7_9BILA|nr:hypothetical protein Y032_0550g3318 [Ancylostoma ceylanicum]
MILDCFFKIRTLELRNHDLSTEVCWLRQQCTIACPDVPNGSVATFVPPSCSEQCQVERKVLHDTVAEQNVDLNRLRLDVERLTAVDMRKDIRISELIKELDSAKSRIIGLEELCRNQIGGLTLSTSSCEAKKEMVEETVPGEGEKTGIIEVAEEGREDTPSEKPFGGPAKNSNLRILTSRRRPTLRNIFTMGKQPGIDGKVRPSTAAGTSSAIPFVPPPLERGETVPILRSMEIMWGIPHGNEEHDKKSNIIGNPSCADKGTTLDSDADSDIDVTDILECSHKSTTLSQRSQSSKSRDSGFCRGESISTRSLSNKPIV